MELQDWINLNRLDAQISFNICSIGDKKYLILERGENESIFNPDFDFDLTHTEHKILSQNEIKSVLFEFGNNWYHSDIENVKLNIFKYLGAEKSEFSELSLPYLGIHGEYDLCNGSRPYDEWVKKAKFLKTPSLGICENNTLAGTLAFQLACKGGGVKSILGETITVSSDNEGKQLYKVKLYVKDYQGWVNLLNINSQIKVFNDNFVTEEYLSGRVEGLVCILPIDSIERNLTKYKALFKDDLFCQLDFIEWSSADRDTSHLESLSIYFSKYIDKIKPALICDSYYLDKAHSHIKKILNTIGKIGFQNQSEDQYFKSTEDIYFQIEELSNDQEWPLDILMKALEGANEIDSKCNFEIKLGELHLPQYEMTEEEKSQFQSNEDLFYHLVGVGFQRISYNLAKDEEVYLTRIETEIEVIKKGGFIDYFLILADIVNWCETQNILVGVGRGSGCGSLIAHLLNITGIDPLKYDLLFERFLNEGRIGKSLPDLDTDFASDRRDDVKRYMESRYGLDYVTSIGTYGTLKIKSAIKDVSRVLNMDGKIVNYVTSMIDDDSLDFTGLFKLANNTPPLKRFIQDNPPVIENYPLIANQVKNASIHAAGVIIVPKTYKNQSMTIYDWLPVKKMDGVLVTEWEGPQLEASGYLKEDILGIKQLQKLSDIFTLIKKHYNKTITFKDIPLDDFDVYKLFQDGYNEDVFQFGAVGLKGYCRELKPDVIEDLIATVALYRPGPMESGAHKDYIKIKSGIKSPEYDYMLEEVTKDTYSMYIYQEQVMKAMTILGGFSSVESDDIRSAMGKKKLDKMEYYKTHFLEGAISKGCDKFEAQAIWNKLEVFAQYGFNKCISGDESIYRVGLNHLGKSTFHPTIKEMYEIRNNITYAKQINKLPLHYRYKRCGYGSGFSLNKENRLVSNKIKDIRWEGKKEIFRVTVESGQFIDVTLNHKFPTPKGELPLQDLSKGDLLYINKGYEVEDTVYRFGVDKNHNYPKKGSQGFQKKNTSFTNWRDLSRIKHLEKKCEICGEENSKKFEVYKTNRVKMGKKGLMTELSPITSIDYLKTDDVYDVEMNNPLHTFTTANNIVTCNSHAAAYAHTGYYCQWLKFHFPLEFWSVTLNNSSQEEIAKRIAEMHAVSEVKVLPPDINQSSHTFEVDRETNEIFWSIGSIKFVGEKTLENILQEREKNGKFFSFDEFYDRMKKGVDSRCVTNLILSGCFDKIEKIKSPSQRLSLLKKFLCTLLRRELPEDIADSSNNWKDYFWVLKQKEITGFGYLQFNKIYNSYIEPKINSSKIKYINDLNFQDQSSIGSNKCIVGVISEIVVRNSVKGPFAQLTINCNDQNVVCLIWSEIWEDWKDLILKSKNKIIGITGEVKFDGKYKGENILQTNKETQIEVL